MTPFVLKLVETQKGTEMHTVAQKGILRHTNHTCSGAEYAGSMMDSSGT